MKLPDFPLASWEVPPDSDIPLIAPADLSARARWLGRETECLIRAVAFEGEERLFYREVGSDEVGNWLSESNKLADVAYYAPQTYQSSMRFTHENSSRLFHLDGARYGAAGTHQLIISDRCGEWRSSNKRANFKLPKWGEQFYDWRAAQIGRWVKSELERPDSEVRFAFDWLGLTELEKQSLVFGISPEDLQRIKLLMRYVMHSDKWLGKELWIDSQYSQFANCTWTIYGPDRSYENRGLFSSLMVADETHAEICGPHFHSCDEDEEFPSVPTRFVKWRHLIYKHFGLSSQEETLQKIHFIHDPKAKQIEVTAQMPTAHEKLESVVALREWFTNVYAPGECADLMNS